MSTNQEIRLQQQLDEVHLLIIRLNAENADNLKYRKQYFLEMTDVILKNDELFKELQALREQKPVKDAYIDEQGLSVGRSFIACDRVIPASWKPLFSAPMPAREGWKLVPIEPTEEMLEVYRTWHREGLQYMDIGIYKAIIEAAPKEPS